MGGTNNSNETEMPTEMPEMPTQMPDTNETNGTNNSNEAEMPTDMPEMPTQMPDTNETNDDNNSNETEMPVYPWPPPHYNQAPSLSMKPDDPEWVEPIPWIVSGFLL